MVRRVALREKTKNLSLLRANSLYSTRGLGNFKTHARKIADKILELLLHGPTLLHPAWV